MLHIAPNFFRGFIAASAVGEGGQAYNEKRFQDTIRLLTPVSKYKINDVSVGTAQYLLGVIYYHGLGTDKDIEKAKGLFKKAVSNNEYNKDAQKYLTIIKANEEC